MVLQDSTLNRKEAILDAAEEVFSQFGFDKARVEAIAQVAGVAKGTIYLYFPSKQELFISLVENRIEGFNALLEKGLLHVHSPQELLETVVKTRLSFYREHSGMVKLLFQTMSHLSCDLQKRIKEAMENTRNIANRSYEAILPPAFPLSPDTFRAIVTGSINGLLFEILVSKREVNPEEIVSQIVQVFLPSIEKYQDFEESSS